MKILDAAAIGLPPALSVILLWWALGIGIILVLTSCSASSVEGSLRRPDVALVARPTFSKDIQPILNDYCVKCHQPKDAHGRLYLQDYQGLMAGSANGAVVVPGRPEESILVMLMTRETPRSLRMPFHQEPLTSNRIQNIENWISLGAHDN